MSLSKTRKGSTINNIVDYTLPKLHTGKNWYVDFTCFDPADGKMRRKKYMLDSIAKISDQKKRAAETSLMPHHAYEADGIHGLKHQQNVNMPNSQKLPLYT